MTVDADLDAIASRFDVAGAMIEAVPFAGGHINDSFRVTFGHRGRQARYLLQRINDEVFGDPASVMENIERVTAHIAGVLERDGIEDVGRHVLRPIRSREGATHHRDAAGGYWRLYRWIDGSRVCSAVATPEQVRQAGRAFGLFQRQLADYAGPRLHETIPNFHDTPRRYAALDRAIDADASDRASSAKAEIRFAMSHRGAAGDLIDAQRRGELPERIVHNDAKIDNVLFDASSGDALCVVDLDTVMPGLAVCDFGDMVRSMSGGFAEDEADLSKVGVCLPLFEGLARGYLETAGATLTAAERERLVAAGTLISLEQGVRFLTDYLDGDRYYKTSRPGQNLDRCRTQFRLVESIADHEGPMEAVVRGFSA